MLLIFRARKVEAKLEHQSAQLQPLFFFLHYEISYLILSYRGSLWKLSLECFAPKTHINNIILFI